MRRRDLLAGSGTVATAALAGCLGSVRGDDDSSSESSRTIAVSESGEATADPDLAVVQVGVEATGDSTEAVRDELATRADGLEDALLAFGIDEEDVTTDGFDIRERVEERRMQEEGVDPDSRDEAEPYVYYEGSHSFTVDVHDVEETGDVIDTAVDAGADTVGRIEFTLSQERRDELREEALQEALEDARSEADFVAHEVDASIVDVERIDTTGGRVSPMRTSVEMDAAEDDATPETDLQPGDVTVSASVDVVYEMA